MWCKSRCEIFVTHVTHVRISHIHVYHTSMCITHLCVSHIYVYHLAACSFGLMSPRRCIRGRRPRETPFMGRGSPATYRSEESEGHKVGDFGDFREGENRQNQQLFVLIILRLPWQGRYKSLDSLNYTTPQLTDSFNFVSLQLHHFGLICCLPSI